MKPWLAGLLVIAGCTHAVYEIAPYQVPCTEEGDRLCLLRTGSQDSLIYDDIEDFDFEWGIETTGRVRFTAIAFPPGSADAGQLTMTGDPEQNPVEDGTGFTWNVPATANGFAAWLDVDSRRFGDDQPFVCTSAAACQAVSDAEAAGNSIEVDFVFEGDEIRLIDAR